MHQQHNYPMWKPRGSLDVGLPDGTDDESFLRQLGGLRLTKEGLRQRDRLVIDTVRRAGVPLVVTLAGGYARRVEDTVAIHVATIEAAGSAN
jgi:acetoin utilization deacetylase AcuC-like enzyme